MNLRINPLVTVDMKNIKEFISEDNPDAAQQTIQEIYSQFEKVHRFPNMGVDLSKRVNFRTDYKYVILYKVGMEYVEIYQ